MTTWFLILTTIMLGFVANSWSAKGWLNLILKLAYTIVSVWSAGLMVVSLGWVA